jgi:HAD superfamily hydrolase (TIGR01662 family)
MSNLVAFDLDETLIKGHVARPDPAGPFEQVLPFLEVTPLPGAVEKIQKLARTPGVKLAVCTNKAGVAWGHATEAECREKMWTFFEVFGLADHELEWYEAYGHPDAPAELGYRDHFLWLRKPAPGMLLQAMIDAGEEPQTTLFVGDMKVDLEAAYRAGCEFRWAYKYFGRPKPPIE